MARKATPDLLGETLPADESLDAMLGHGDLLPSDQTLMPVADILIGNRMRQVNMTKALELAESITTIGLLEPLVVQQNRTLVAGRHRLEALRLLGWPLAPVRVVLLSDLDAELAEIDENLIRNELTVLDRGVHLARRKEIYEALHPETRHGASGGWHNNKGASLENEKISFSSDAAAKLGVSARSVQHEVSIGQKIIPAVQNEIIKRGQIVEDTPEQRRLDKLATSKSELLYLARQDGERQIAILERIKAGAASVKEAERELQEERIVTNVVRVDAPWLLVGDFRVVGAQIPDESVDLIFTDPPYDEASAVLYGDLAAFAARVLRPGGLLLAYSGQLHLPQIYASMGLHLDYLWTCAIGHAAGATWFRKWHLLNQWKPILMYGKPPIVAWWRVSFADYVSGGKEKSDHPWQQSLAEATHYISALCPAGGLVLDPFAGSGTTLLAAKQLCLRYIGIEKDPSTARRARARVMGESEA